MLKIFFKISLDSEIFSKKYEKYELLFEKFLKSRNGLIYATFFKNS